MPQQQYVSPFEAAVGNFLSSYAAMKGLRMQQGEAADRRKQAQRADQMARIQMNEAGYDEVQMPTIEAPPGQSWAQRIGRMISGGPEQPGSIVMKTHPSIHEQDLAGERDFITGRDTANFAHQDLLEAIKAKNERALNADRESGADRRNTQDNATRLQSTAMEVAPRTRALTNDERASFAHDAVWAAQGSGVAAIKAVLADGRLSARAKALGVTPVDYASAQQEFADRLTAKSRGMDPFAADLDAKLKGGNPATGSDPYAGPRAAWDRAAGALRQQGRDPASELGPRPPNAPGGNKQSGDIDLRAGGTHPNNGASTPTTGTAPRAPLSAHDKSMAKSDPKFAAFLTANGYRAGVDF
jgi:hypothetical protein